MKGIFFLNIVHKLIAEKKGLESESRKIEDGVFGDVKVIKTEKNDKETLQLPEFSSGVKMALSQGNSSKVWSQMIEELITFYARRYPNRLKCSEDYQIVGRLMYSAYPSIGRFGTHQWVN